MTPKKYKRTTHFRRLPTFPGIWGALGLAHGPKERNWRSMSSCHCCSFCFCFILKIDFRIFFQIDDNDAAAIGAGRFSTRGAQNRSFPQKQTRGSGFPSRPRKFIGFPDDHAVKDTSSDPPRKACLSRLTASSSDRTVSPTVHGNRIINSGPRRTPKSQSFCVFYVLQNPVAAERTCGLSRGVPAEHGGTRS